MSNKDVLSLAVLTTVVALSAQLSFAQTGNWEVSAGAIFLNRDANYNGEIVVDNGHNPLLGSQDFETGYHGGFYTMLTRNLNDTYSIDARYFTIDDWTEIASASTTNGAWLYGGSTLGDTTITEMTGVFASDLNSLEISLGYQYQDWLRLLAGFRWLSIDETLNISFFQGVTEYAEYAGFVKNDLYGFQGGAEALLFDNGGPLTVDSIFKAGVFGNDIRYDGAYENGVAAQIIDSTQQTSFVGEIGITGNLLLTDNIQLSGGYQLLWISGIGLLAEQLSAADWTSGNGVDTDGSALYHGATVNLTIFR